jgi:hypothetical protein
MVLRITCQSVERVAHYTFVSIRGDAPLLLSPTHSAE